MRTKWPKKNVFYTCVLEFCKQQRPGMLHFVKKSKSLCPSVHASPTLTRVGWFFHHDGIYARKWPLQSSVYNVLGIHTPPPTYCTLRLLCTIYTSVPHKEIAFNRSALTRSALTQSAFNQSNFIQSASSNVLSLSVLIHTGSTCQCSHSLISAGKEGPLSSTT
jgi:hypothetical protein